MSVQIPITGTRTTRRQFRTILSIGRSALAAFVLCCAAKLAPSAAAAKWDPIDPKDLVATESQSSPGVAAEILLSEHELSEGKDFTRTKDHIRAKIYTQKGVEDSGRLSIYCPEDWSVRTPEARVVKPDGRVVELKKTDIFETVVAKIGQEKLRKVSFAFPDLAPGDVVEYRWVTYRNGDLFAQWSIVQDELPVREYRLWVGDMTHPGRMNVLHCPEMKIDESSSSLEAVAHGIPAFEAEEFMPAQREFRGWLTIVRTFPAFGDKDVWNSISSYWNDEFEADTRPGGGLKRKAAELIAGATSDDEKLRRLYDFCQSEIVNYSWVNSPEIQEAREKSRKESAVSVGRVLERRAGWSDDVDRLFAGLARGAGFKVRQGRNASKAAITAVRGADGWAFVDRTSVGVEVGGVWRYFRPGSYFTPFGMLPWQDEGTTMVRCDDRPQFDSTPMATAAASRATRVGHFTLDAEGTLEGSASESYTGHLAIALKSDKWSDSAEDIDKHFREEVAKRLPSAEVTDIVWTNLRTRELPLHVQYRLRVPGYAEQAGKRLVVVPSFFEAGAPVVFAAAERKFPIVFPHARYEHDEIQIVLPDGYTLDQPSAPKPVADGSKSFTADYKLQYAPKSRTLSLVRDYTLGGSGVISFRTESYPLLKALFERQHASDTHAILLKPREGPAAPAVSETEQRRTAQP